MSHQLSFSICGAMDKAFAEAFNTKKPPDELSLPPSQNFLGACGQTAEIIEVDENEETVDTEEELDDIDKKFDETKGPKLKYK